MFFDLVYYLVWLISLSYGESLASSIKFFICIGQAIESLSILDMGNGYERAAHLWQSVG